MKTLVFCWTGGVKAEPERCGQKESAELCANTRLSRRSYVYIGHKRERHHLKADSSLIKTYTNRSEKDANKETGRLLLFINVTYFSVCKFLGLDVAETCSGFQ